MFKSSKSFHFFSQNFPTFLEAIEFPHFEFPFANPQNKCGSDAELKAGIDFKDAVFLIRPGHFKKISDFKLFSKRQASYHFKALEYGN